MKKVFYAVLISSAILAGASSVTVRATVPAIQQEQGSEQENFDWSKITDDYIMKITDMEKLDELQQKWNLTRGIAHCNDDIFYLMAERRVELFREQIESVKTKDQIENIKSEVEKLVDARKSIIDIFEDKVFDLLLKKGINLNSDQEKKILDILKDPETSSLKGRESFQNKVAKSLGEIDFFNETEKNDFLDVVARSLDEVQEVRFLRVDDKNRLLKETQDRLYFLRVYNGFLEEIFKAKTASELQTIKEAVLQIQFEDLKKHFLDEVEKALMMIKEFDECFKQIEKYNGCMNECISNLASNPKNMEYHDCMIKNFNNLIMLREQISSADIGINFALSQAKKQLLDIIRERIDYFTKYYVAIFACFSEPEDLLGLGEKLLSIQDQNLQNNLLEKIGIYASILAQ